MATFYLKVISIQVSEFRGKGRLFGCKALLVVGLFLPMISSAQVSPLLKKIAALQCQGDAFYRDGMFPSLRWGAGGKARDDNNIFFTALTVYTLQQLYPFFTEDERKLSDSIIQSAQANYPFYSNRNGEPSYNFWQVHPFEQPFPNRKLWSKMKKFRLADDLDDTSLIYMTLPSSDSVNQAVRKMMADQVDDRPVRSAFRGYRGVAAYRTWFAKKMKQDLDLCVMTNALLFVHDKNLPFDEHEKHTISFINHTVKKGLHMKYPRILSPHYQKSAVILYHLVRLRTQIDHPLLNELTPMLIQDLKGRYKATQNAMEKVVLQISLLRLGIVLPEAIAAGAVSEQDKENFYWFHANPWSGHSLLVKKILGQRRFLQSRYTSEAYYTALLLQYEILSNRLIR